MSPKLMADALPIQATMLRSTITAAFARYATESNGCDRAILAMAHGLTLVTRNLKEIEDSAVRCINPFEVRNSRV